MSEARFTKGPWMWVVSKSDKRVELCGSGIEVLRFKRLGMQNAQPTFTESYRGHTLQGVKSLDLLQKVKGREHHSDWFQTINHPDAKLIECSPDLYAEIERDLIEQLETQELIKGKLVDEQLNASVIRKQNLLAKARGEL